MSKAGFDGKQMRRGAQLDCFCFQVDKGAKRNMIFSVKESCEHFSLLEQGGLFQLELGCYSELEPSLGYYASRISIENNI